MNENPFIFGKVVKGEHFCDREKEMAQVKKIVNSKQHMVIISPRRYGKTSLVINAMEKNKIPFLYIDCTLIDDEKSLANMLVNEFAKKIDNTAMLEKILKKVKVSFSISLNPLSVTVEQVKMDSLKGIVTEITKHYVIAFDEFQDLYEKDKKLVNKLRSVVQFLEKTIIMLGSKRHLLQAMFLKPRGIFYNFGYALHLEKIGEEEFKTFIAHWFKKNHIELTKTDLDEILEISQCHPFFTQYLCHFLFEKRSVGKTTVSDVLGDILKTNAAFYEETFRTLPSSQRKALLLLCSGKKELYSAEALKQFNIANTQTLQKSLKALIKKEIIDKNGNYHILDVFVERWL